VQPWRSGDVPVALPPKRDSPLKTNRLELLRCKMPWADRAFVFGTRGGLSWQSGSSESVVASVDVITPGKRGAGFHVLSAIAR